MTEIKRKCPGVESGASSKSLAGDNLTIPSSADIWAELADAALANRSGYATRTIAGREIIAVSDVMAVEFEANGKKPLPPCPTLQRSDGRLVFLLELPAVSS